MKVNSRKDILIHYFIYDIFYKSLMYPVFKKIRIKTYLTIYLK